MTGKDGMSTVPLPYIISMTTPAITILSATPGPGYLITDGNSNIAPSPMAAGGTQVVFGAWRFGVDPESKKLTYFPEGKDATTVAITSGVISSTPTATGSPENTASDLHSSITSPAQNSSSNTASTASTSLAMPQSKKADGGLSTGAVAGIAIGCLFAGALVAGCGLWFFLRKTRRSRRGPIEEGNQLTMLSPEKGAIAKTISLGSGSPISPAVDSVLPQPLEDKAISTGISGIGNAIKNHVQSYYHSGRVSPGILDLDDLQGLGSDLPISTGTLSTLLGNPDTREIALRFCIGWVVVSRMQLSSPPDQTFLPAEIAECLRDIASTAQTPHNQKLFLSKWRTITAELTQTTYVTNAFSASDSRLPNIEKAITLLDGILRPYGDFRMDNTQRIQNLREMFKRAATFAFTLFSQPGVFEFDWQEQLGVRSGSLCIFPALVQTVDETGEPVRPPRAFSEATSRPLGV